jgi:hypothetical protein
MNAFWQPIVNTIMVISLIVGCLATVSLPLVFINRSDRVRKKCQAIMNYGRCLSRLLEIRHGKKDHYLPTQVKDMIQEWGYSTTYDHYGLAMYCNAADFMAYYQAIGKEFNYEALRNEVSQILFGTQASFTVSDLLAINVLKTKARANSGDSDSQLPIVDVSGVYDCGDSGSHCDGGDSRSLF